MVDCRWREKRAAAVHLEELRMEGRVRRLRRATDRIENVEEARRRLSEQIEHVAIVRVPDGLPRHTLLVVKQLLGLEGALDEEVLQCLVGVVDAELRGQWKS